MPLGPVGDWLERDGAHPRRGLWDGGGWGRGWDGDGDEAMLDRIVFGDLPRRPQPPDFVDLQCGVGSSLVDVVDVRRKGDM